MSTLYRARKPVKKESETKKGRAWFYASQKRLLKIRCQGQCEWCHRSLLDVGGDADHIWGRAGTGAGLGWPFCDLVECLFALCRECHDRRPTDAYMDGILKRTSLRRLARRFDQQTAMFVTSDDLVASVRDLFNGADVSVADILEGRR